jgi:hypothetical protein
MGRRGRKRKERMREMKKREEKTLGREREVDQRGLSELIFGQNGKGDR